MTVCDNKHYVPEAAEFAVMLNKYGLRLVYHIKDKCYYIYDGDNNAITKLSSDAEMIGCMFGWEMRQSVLEKDGR